MIQLFHSGVYTLRALDPIIETPAPAGHCCSTHNSQEAETA